MLNIPNVLGNFVDFLGSALEIFKKQNFYSHKSK